MKKILFAVAVLAVVILIGFLTWQFDFKRNSAPQVETPQQNMEEENSKAVEGLQIEVLQGGAGQETKTGDRVDVHYTGYFENGEVFDSSVGRGEPFSFVLGAGNVIKGWDLGVVGMKVGEKRKLTIAPQLAYGASGAPGAIPPNSTLIFEVELIAIRSDL